MATFQRPRFRRARALVSGTLGEAGAVVHGNRRSAVNGALVVFAVVASFVSAFQLLDFISATQLGFPIPDVVIYSRTLTYWEGARMLLSEHNYIKGLTAIYGWTWSISPAICLLINALLLGVAAYYARASTAIDDFENFAQLGILLNGYLILALPGPNKEIPLLAATLIYFWLLRTPSLANISLAVIIGCLCITIRDGYGVFLAAWALAAATIYSSRLKASAAIFGCALGAMAQPLLVRFAVVSRNAGVAENIAGNHHAIGGIASQLPFSPDDPFGAVALFAVRLVYNWSYMALNPILFTTNGDINALGWAYWIYGLCLFVTIPVAVWMLFYGVRREVNEQAAFVIGTLSIVSLSLYVQPRYMMPVLPFASTVFFYAPKRIQRAAAIFGLVVSFLFIAGHVFSGKTENVRPENYGRTDYYQRS